MNILIAGDFYIADNFKNQKPLNPAVEKLLAGADYRIINLEVPITSDNPKNI